MFLSSTSTLLEYLCRAVVVCSGVFCQEDQEMCSLKHYFRPQVFFKSLSNSFMWFQGLFVFWWFVSLPSLFNLDSCVNIGQWSQINLKSKTSFVYQKQKVM